MIQAKAGSTGSGIGGAGAQAAPGVTAVTYSRKETKGRMGKGGAEYANEKTCQTRQELKGSHVFHHSNQTPEAFYQIKT